MVRFFGVDTKRVKHAPATKRMFLFIFKHDVDDLYLRTKADNR